MEQLAQYIVENRENKEWVEEFLELMIKYHNDKVKEAYTLGWYESMAQEAKEQEKEKIERIFDNLYGKEK